MALLYEESRQTVLNAINEAVALKLINGTSGNISMRTPEDSSIFAITPSSVPYEGMTAEDISIVKMHENGENEWIDGKYKPSSEVPMHAGVFRARADVNAAVHTHSMYATVCAMGKEELKPITPPHCEFSPIKTVEFFPPGSEEISVKINEALGKTGRVCLIKNHGMFSVGKDMSDAMHAAVYTEEMAQTTVIAKMLGIYEPMPEKDVKIIKEMLYNNLAV